MQDRPPSTPVELLARMVATGSVNPAFGGPPGSESPLADYLESVARGWGLATRRHDVPGGCDNLLVTHEAVPGSEWLLFECHLDTVGTAGMTVPPFELTSRGNRLHGRGACDAKGSGAAMLWALREYARAPRRPRNAGVLFVTDEEAGMTGARAFAAHGLAEIPHLRGIIVGEPTELRPIVAHNGALRWRSVTRGLAAHSSDPRQGRSAIRAMLRVVAALEERFIPLATAAHPLTGRAAASINVIHGGEAVNVIPDFCEILCDRRLVPGEDPAQVLAARDAALASLEVEHDRLYLAPPLPPENASALHAWLRPALDAAGLDGAPAGAPYATDASHYAAAGAPAIVLGPGNIAQAHTADEWLDHRQLTAAIDLYGRILQLPP